LFQHLHQQIKQAVLEHQVKVLQVVQVVREAAVVAVLV
jgi:hypothetical protein